jgi:hypothetical protein
VDEKIKARFEGDFPLSTQRISNTWTSLEPNRVGCCFHDSVPEHDDANRALMGSNMQRQAVH